MRRLRFIVVAVVLTVTAFAGGLMVSASLNAPTNVTAANKTINNVAATTSNEVSSAAGLTTATSNQVINQNVDAIPYPIGVRRVTNPYVQGVISSTIATNNGYTLALRDRQLINLDTQTTVGDAKGTINAAGLKAGDYIFALGQFQADNSLLARWVLRLPPLPQVQRGQVTLVDAATNSFQFKSGSETWTANLISTTKIFKNRQPATFSQIQVNDDVAVTGSVDVNGHTIQASFVEDGAFLHPDNAVNGIINTIDSTNNSFTITPTVHLPMMPLAPGSQPSPQNQVKVAVDTNTKFLGANSNGLSSLKPGDHVIVIGERQSDGSIKAKSVTRVPNLPPRESSSPAKAGDTSYAVSLSD